jgi:hypothetical protein
MNVSRRNVFCSDNIIYLNNTSEQILPYKTLSIKRQCYLKYLSLGSTIERA